MVPDMGKRPSTSPAPSFLLGNPAMYGPYSGVGSDTEEDGGSTPPAPTTQALTSANAGQVGARGRFSGPRAAEGTIDGCVVDETT